MPETHTRRLVDSTVSKTAWDRLGLRRTPWLTASVAAVTLAGGIAQFILPDLLGGLERSPAGLHGQWWRTGTALVVQDGGPIGLVSNLIFLVAVGAVAEQVLTRRRWLLQYVGTGLAAELVGYALQPIGGGNSIAICGLVSAVAVTAWRDRAQLPSWGPSVVLVWCGALLAYLWEPLIVLGIIGGVVAGRAVRTGRRAGLPVLLGVLAAAVVLAAAANIHGAALLIGAALALIDRRRVETDMRPVRPPARTGLSEWSRLSERERSRRAAERYALNQGLANVRRGRRAREHVASEFPYRRRRPAAAGNDG